MSELERAREIRQLQGQVKALASTVGRLEWLTEELRDTVIKLEARIAALEQREERHE